MFSNFNATDNIVSAAAYIFAKDTDGSYLILCGRRSGNDPRHQGGYYDVPVGMREMGETPQQTARRETLEETGIAIPVNMFRFIEKQTWGGGRAGSNFLVILDKPLRIGQGDTEHDDTRWLPVDKVHTLRWAYGMDSVIDRYYGQFITNNTQGRKTTMTEKQLSRLISETISNVISEGHYELYGYGTNYPKIIQHAIDTNATNLEDYDNQEREALKILRQKGEVGQNHHPQATVYNNGENTPVSNASIDASFYKYGDNSDQILANMRENKDANCKKISRRQLNKLISESIMRVLSESFASRKLDVMARQHGGVRKGRDGAWAWIDGRYSIPISYLTDDMIADDVIDASKGPRSAIYFNDGTAVQITDLDGVRNLVRQFDSNAEANGRYSSDIADRKYVPTTEKGKQAANIRRSLAWANKLKGQQETPGNWRAKQNWDKYSRNVRPKVNDVYNKRAEFDDNDLTAYGAM